jgi:ATP-binding cassette subfamily B protein
MALAVFGFILCAGYLAERLLYEYRQEMFSHLQKLPFSFYDRTPVGWIMSRMTSDVGRIADLATWMFLDTLWAVMNITASAYFMFTINAQLALAIILIVPL